MEGLWSPWGPLVPSCARPVPICRMLSLGPQSGLTSRALTEVEVTVQRSGAGGEVHGVSSCRHFGMLGVATPRHGRDTRPVTDQLQLQGQ